MSPLADWIRGPRRTPRLHPPDGRSLYRYRLDDDDFASLERALRAALAQCSSLDILPEIEPAFPRLFVLYAAEWWRRRYDGSGWSWASILSDLGAATNHWSQARRGECVERGLRAWGLDRTQAGGLRYLRAIALQGGLPLRPLSEARGALGRVLSRVLSLARGSQPGPHLIRGWVASLGGELPQSYRREEVYELLAEVVTTVLGLVREAGLTPHADTLARLDARCPDWRDRFPLPVGDREAAALIEQLIREAVRLPAPSSGRLRVERWLERDGEGWRLCSSLAPLERLDERGLRDWFGADPGRLPRAIQLRLESGDQALSWQGRRLAGQGAWRIEAQPRSLEGAVAAADHRLVLSLGDGQAWPGQPRRGQALDSDLPWIFEERPGGLPRWVRDGSGSVTPQYALVVASAGSQVIPESDGSAEQAGILAALGRTVWRVLGRVRVQASSGAYWRIATGQAGAREADYHWVRDQVWLDLIDPPLAFRGRPRLFDGETPVQSHRLRWTPDGNSAPGPVRVTLDRDGVLTPKLWRACPSSPCAWKPLRMSRNAWSPSDPRACRPVPRPSPTRIGNRGPG